MTGSGLPVVSLSRAERRLIDGLRRAGAVNAGTARPLDPRGLESGRLESLLEAGVILEAAPGVYYVDETAYEQYHRDKRLGFVALIAAAVLIGLIVGVALIF